MIFGGTRNIDLGICSKVMAAALTPIKTLNTVSESQESTAQQRNSEESLSFVIRQEDSRVHPYINRHPNVQASDLRATFSATLDLSAWSRLGINYHATGYSLPPLETADLSPPFSLVVSRKAILEDDSKRTEQNGPLIMTKGNNRVGLVAQSSASIYKSTYKSYSQQGPERSTLAPLAEKQDEDDFAQGRTTTFSWIDEMESFSYQNYWGKLISGGSAEYIKVAAQPIGQLHVLLSRSATEPLHTEVVTPAIVRGKGELIAELGRLHFLEGDKLNIKSRNARDQYGKIRLIRELFRQAYSWMLNDAGVDRVFYQVNQKMIDKIKEYGIPTQLAKILPFDREYIGADGEKIKVREYRLEFDKPAMERTEEILTAENLTAVLERFLEVAEKRKNQYPNPLLELHFTMNEIPALARLSVINFTSNGGGDIANTLDQHLLRIPNADGSGVWQVNSALRNAFLKAMAGLSKEGAKEMLSTLHARMKSEETN